MFCLSPVGSLFRQRLRNFPALLTSSCTAMWFAEWPVTAMGTVATFMLKPTDNDIPELVLRSIPQIHMSARKVADMYFSETNVRVYVTPSSFLDFLANYLAFVEEQRKELPSLKARYEHGLTVLETAAKDVHSMKEHLKVLV